MSIKSLFFLLSLYLLSISLSTCTINLLTTSYPPFSDCSDYEPSNSSTVHGAEIQLLRDAFSYLNWTEGLDYEFTCMTNYSELLSTLEASLDSLVGIAGGLSITSTRLEQNHIFSHPTVSASLPLVYKKQSKGWFFRRGLTIMTWVVLFSVVFVVGGILYLLENRKTAYVNMVYNAFCQFFFVPDFPLKSFGAKLVQFFSTFVVLIVLEFFTATATNIFQDDQAIPKTLSLATIGNHSIYTFDIYAGYMAQLGISTMSIDEYDQDELMEIIEELGDNYLVVDGPYRDFILRRYCDLFSAISPIDVIHYGIMYGDDFPESSRLLINRAIIQINQENSFQSYVTKYYNDFSSNVTCTTDRTFDDSAVTFESMIGLWYILGVGGAVGVIFLVLDLLGIAVNKTVREYSLHGIRSKMDRKVKRRVATLFAIYAGVSIQCIAFLKKLNQEALQGWLSTLKENFSTKAINASYNKILKEKGEDEQQANPIPRKRKGRGFTIFSSKPKSPIRTGTTVSWMKATPKQNEETKEPPESPIKDEVILISPTTKKAINNKRSSLLTQTMKNFKLRKSLIKKLGGIVEKTPKSGEVEMEGATTLKSEFISLGIANSLFDKDFPRGPGKSVTIIKRIFGKKGMKKNKQITNTANALLTKKEEDLIKEFDKKKLEIHSRHPLLLNFRKRSTSSFLSKNTLHPHQFKTKLGQYNSLKSGKRTLFGSLSHLESFKANELSPKRESEYRFIRNQTGKRDLNSRDLSLIDKNKSIEVNSGGFSALLRRIGDAEENYDQDSHHENYGGHGSFHFQEFSSYNFLAKTRRQLDMSDIKRKEYENH